MDQPRLAARFELLPEVTDVDLADVLVALEVVAPRVSSDFAIT
jgi:hypothetical protein